MKSLEQYILEMSQTIKPGTGIKDEGMKLINKFLKTINPNHKDI